MKIAATNNRSSKKKGLFRSTMQNSLFFLFFFGWDSVFVLQSWHRTMIILPILHASTTRTTAEASYVSSPSSFFPSHTQSSWSQKIKAPSICDAAITAAATARNQLKTMRKKIVYICLFGNDNDDHAFSDESSTSTIPTQKKFENDHEISSYYRQDRREWERNGSAIFPPISDPIGLANLLQQRYETFVLYRNSNRSIENEMYLNVTRIDHQLKQQYNVVVYNHPPIWSRFDVTAPPNAIRKQQIQKEMSTLQRAFGPTGHPYRHIMGQDNDGNSDIVSSSYSSSLDCDLSMTDIHNLLSQYTKYKCTFQQELADATLFELTLHGVRLSDRALQWTTHPTSNIEEVSNSHDDVITNSKHNSDLFSRLRKNRNQTVLVRTPYTQDRLSETWIQSNHSVTGDSHDILARPRYDGVNTMNRYLNQPLQQQVEQLVYDRHVALVREECDLAAWIEYELYSTYNVGVSDGTKTWSLGCHFSPPVMSNTSMTTTAWMVPTPPTFIPRKNSVLFPSPLLFVNEDQSFDSVVRYSERRTSLQKSPPKSLPESVNPQKQDCNELLLIRERIQQLVQERIQKREEGKFLEADTLRNVLWRTYVSLFIGITL
jgi:hypothetical protein